MKPVRIAAEAEAELRAAISWYEQERPGLGDDLWTEAKQILSVIAQHPDAGGRVIKVTVRGDVRRMPLRRFPYFVVYRDHPSSVEVLAFAHQSRRPGYWKTRLS